jgi:hypothetical protein
MRKSLSWQRKHTAPQTELIIFDPKEPTNPVLMTLLERFTDIEGFDNTLSRVVIEQKRLKDAQQA